MQIRIDKNARIPIHDQIKEQIVGLIHAGRLKAGDQLPTMRELSIALAVNFNTVAHAYRALDAQGVIQTRRGEGTFVTNTPGEAEMRDLRRQKLESLVEVLFTEANRLGYTPAEVAKAVRAYLTQESEEH